MQIYKNPVKLQNIFPVFPVFFSDSLLYAADPVSISGGIPANYYRLPGVLTNALCCRIL